MKHLTEQVANTEFTQFVRRILRTHKKTISDIEFKVSPSLAFSVSDVESIVNNTEGKITVLVNFLGLIGSTGILPDHYSEYLLSRLQAKDKSMLAFLDIFHDHLLKIYYASRQLSRFYVQSEREGVHKLTDLLQSFSGSSTLLSRDMQCYYSGLLSMRSRNKKSLQLLLRDYFEIPVEIDEYSPRWVRLASDDICRLGNVSKNHRLGVGAILGKRFYHVQDRFIIIIGPIDYEQFQQCLPGSDFMKNFVNVVRAYCGMNYDFTIRLNCRKDQFPRPVLKKRKPLKLGWNTLLTETKESTAMASIRISANPSEMKIETRSFVSDGYNTREGEHYESTYRQV